MLMPQMNVTVEIATNLLSLKFKVKRDHSIEELGFLFAGKFGENTGESYSKCLDSTEWIPATEQKYIFSPANYKLYQS